MNQVLASSAGNTLEVKEALQFLTGEYRNPRLYAVTMALCAEMLVISGLAANDAEAKLKLQTVLDNGKAAECFGKMVAGLGGPLDFVENYGKYLATANVIKPVFASNAGFVSAMDTRAMGMAVVGLGGGRRVASDTIDYSVGFSDVIRLGMQADSSTPLAVVHAKDEAQWQQAAEQLQAAMIIADEAPQATPDVYRQIGPQDV